MSNNLIPLNKIAKHALSLVKAGKMRVPQERNLLAESLKMNLTKMRAGDLTLTLALLQVPNIPPN